MEKLIRAVICIVVFAFLFNTRVQAYELSPFPCTADTPPASLVRRTVPTQMSPGQRANVEFQIANCSGSEWTKNVYKLGSANPLDNLTFQVGRVEFPVSVPTGNSITMSFPIMAPVQTGSYTLQFGLLNLTKWFPPYLTPDLILVGAPITCPNETVLQAVMNTTQDAQPALQNCITSVPEGSIVEIPVGEYLLYNTLKIQKRITLLSKGTADIQATCILLEGVRCARLKAHPNFPVNNSTVLYDSVMISIHSPNGYVSNPALKSLIIDGNHALRTKDPGTYSRYNIYSSATHGMFFYNAIINAGSGTGLSGWGDQNSIVHNYIGMNGTVGKNSNGSGNWADGLSLVGKYFVVMNNYLHNNTDVDLILWGAPHANVHFNTISHDLRGYESFAALMLNTWDKDEALADFTLAEISYNTISCNKLCGFGIQIGEKSWRSTASSIFGGSVKNNKVSGAIQGINIDGAGRPGLPVTVGSNSITNSGGVLTPEGFRTTTLNQNPSDIVVYTGGQTPASSISWGGNGYLLPGCIFSSNYCVNSAQCTGFTYSNWGACVDGLQNRTVLTRAPASCVGGLPITTRICVSTSTPTPTPSICQRADINNDQIVDLSDYTILISNFFKTTLSNPRADINADGMVDLSDYSLLVSNFFKPC